MKKIWGTVSLAAFACLSASVAYAAPTKCLLTFDLHEWSVFYESATGTGKITCDNGQSAGVTIRSKGGGISVGKFEIKDGHGSFTEVASMDEVFGKYLATERDAGASKSADAWVMTKDKVRLAIAGTGKGWELGFSVDEFIVEKQK